MSLNLASNGVQVMEPQIVADLLAPGLKSVLLNIPIFFFFFG